MHCWWQKISAFESEGSCVLRLSGVGWDCNIEEIVQWIAQCPNIIKAQMGNDKDLVREVYVTPDLTEFRLAPGRSETCTKVEISDRAISESFEHDIFGASPALVVESPWCVCLYFAQWHVFQGLKVAAPLQFRPFFNVYLCASTLRRCFLSWKIAWLHPRLPIIQLVLFFQKQSFSRLLVIFTILVMGSSGRLCTASPSTMAGTLRPKSILIIRICCLANLIKLMVVFPWKCCSLSELEYSLTLPAEVEASIHSCNHRFPL